jgi:S-adenosylmethionine decarboxylase
MANAPDAGTDTGAHFGVHLTIDGYGGARDLLADAGYIRACLDELPTRLGMHKITEPLLVEVGEQNTKDPGGLSGFVMIAESHISIHTFPLRGFVSADVYTCQNSLDVERITAYFTDAFALKDIETHLVRRGTRYPQHNIYEPSP